MEKESVVIAPMKVYDDETNRTYILDFNRDTVRFAEERGFKWDDFEDHIATYVPLIWFCAFRRYDPRISLEKTTKLLDDLGGMRPKWIKRLRELYDQALSTLVADDDDEVKNGHLTVEL